MARRTRAPRLPNPRVAKDVRLVKKVGRRQVKEVVCTVARKSDDSGIPRREDILRERPGK